MDTEDCGFEKTITTKTSSDKLFRQIVCNNCKGSGNVEINSYGAFGESESYNRKCPDCIDGFEYKEQIEKL